MDSADYYYHEQHYNDGANPVASLIYVNGKFYGTTYSGGASQYYGTVFRINAPGQREGSAQLRLLLP